MRRYLVAYLLAFNIATVGAQPPKESVPPTASNRYDEEVKVIYQLEVSPAAEPRPAMKYRLLPNPTDLKRGNAATQYYKAFVLEAESPVRTKAFTTLREKYLEVPLERLDLDEFGKILESLREDVFYRSIRVATFRSRCDWEEPIDEDGVYTLMPALSAMRGAGILLTLKAKHEIGRGDHDNAFSTARDAFTLGYRMQQDGEVLVQGLTGVAIIGVMHDDFFLEWIRSPNSPNLYWALAEIPPYFEFRRVIAGDLSLAEHTLPALEDIQRRPMTAEEAADLAAKAFAVEAGSRLDKNDRLRRMQLAAWAFQAYDESYRELSEVGYSRALLDQMPVLQVALLGRWKRFEQHRDDLYKWTTVVHGPARELALRKQNEIHRQAEVSAAPFGVFLPALAGVYRAQLRQHRFLCVLMTIEALRLYAAANGSFPDTLADVRDVPVPDDPVTRAPFVYRGGGKNATLTMIRHELGADMEYEYRLRLR